MDISTATLGLLERIGFTFGQIIINDLILRDVFFAPWTSEKEMTTEAIDGDINTDIDTYSKIKQQEYEVKGFFQMNIFSFSDPKSDFQKLNDIFLKNEVFSFLGTDFDDKTFAIRNLKKIKEGLNFIEFSFVAKEMIFAMVETFTEDSKNIPQAAKSKNSSGTVKSSGKDIPLQPY